MHRAILFALGLSAGVVAGYLLHPEPPLSPSNPPPTNDAVAHPSATDTAAGGFARQAEPEAAPALLREAADVGTAPKLEYDPAFGTLVYGMVRSRDGTPLAEARLTFTSADSKIRRSADVAAGSGYALTGLSPGRWNVYSKPTDFAALRSEIEILAQPTQRLDFTFDPSFLVTVKLLTPEGQPLHEAVQAAKLGHWVDPVVVASRRPIEGDLPMTELRSYSRYGIGSWRGARGFEAREGKPVAMDIAGTLELSEAPPVFVAAVFRHLVLATATVEAGQQEVVLEVPLDKVRGSLSTIRLQVTNGSTGAPVEGARVAISDSQSGGGGLATDAEGRITLANERVGILELDIFAKDLEHYHQLLRLDPGEHDLGTIALFPAQEITVAVSNSDGTPAAGATVQWQNLDRRTFPQPSMYRRSGRTDAEGQSKLSIGPGSHMVQAFDADSHVTAVVNAAANAGQPVQLVLRPSLKVEIAATFDVERTELHCLTIYDARRTPVWARFLRGYPTNASLPAGRYSWELHDGTTLLRNGEFELKPGAETPTIGAR